MAPKTNSKVKLIETAIDLVRMSSYTDVGVNEICEKAGVTKGAFYHHFKSKATLYAEAAAYKMKNEEMVLQSLLAERHESIKKLDNMIGYIYSKVQKLQRRRSVVARFLRQGLLTPKVMTLSVKPVKNMSVMKFIIGKRSLMI